MPPIENQHMQFDLRKGGFFSESAIHFLDLQILKKKYSKKTILNFKFEILAQNSIMLWVGVLNFKFKIVFWNILFSRFGDLKNESHFLKKATFRSHKNLTKSTRLGDFEVFLENLDSKRNIYFFHISYFRYDLFFDFQAKIWCEKWRWQCNVCFWWKDKLLHDVHLLQFSCFTGTVYILGQ